jgi:DNA repair exonuclease SbcCD nuclease subunit
MSRVLAFADTQIGVQTVDLADQRAVLDQIVQIALDREVDVVLHGGDVFEGPIVTPEHMRTFIDGVKPLWRQRQIPLVITLGNGRHDSAMRSVHALDVLDEVDGIEIHDRPGITAHGGVGIVTLPWVQPGHLLAKLNGNIDRDQVNDYMSKTLVEIAHTQLERLHQSRFVHEHQVLLAHWAISGSKLPTGLAVEEMREPILPWADLDALGYDAIIGAHIHQQQIISQPFVDKTLGVVLGSPQQLNFGEHGDHGCWIFGLADGGVGAEFIPLDSPRFITLDLDPEDLADRPSDAADRDWSGDIVRVCYTATEEQASRVDASEVLREMLAAGASRVAIHPNVIRPDRARVDTITEQLSQVEALAKWCEANDIDPQTQHRMVGRLQEWA